MLRILPNEFGSDNSNPNMVDPLPPVKMKAMYLKQVEERGSNWIGFVNGCWYDFVCESLNLFLHLIRPSHTTC